MVFKIIQLAKLVLHEVKVKNRVLELFVFWVFTAFVTAAGQQSEQNEYWNARYHEYWMLK